MIETFITHPTIYHVCGLFIDYSKFNVNYYINFYTKRHGYFPYFVEGPDSIIGLLDDDDNMMIMKVGFDFPVLVKSPNPNGETIAIVGERPLRTYTYSRELAHVSFSDTFGQNRIEFKYNPRPYDLLIDYYLNEGYDVYCTNLNKMTKYDKNESTNLFKMDSRDLACLHGEFRMVKPCHVIWLGDSSEKRFYYSKYHISCNIYPHLSGSANGKWKEILSDVPCTAENKVAYITDPSHTNIICDYTINKLLNEEKES